MLLKAASLLATIRVLLWVFPFPVVRPWLDIAGRRSLRFASGSHSPDWLAWTVLVASRFVPGGGHCLSQALALQVLLQRRGYSCKICFGVHRGNSNGFSAHAWLEHDGAVLIGGDHLGRFVRLTSRADSAS